MRPARIPTARGWAVVPRSEGGFAMIGALLVMVLVTALGGAAIFLSQMDLTLAGNYRVQRTAEVAADGALDLTKAMIYGNVPLLNLPLSIPTTDSAARAWRQDAAYSDADIDVAVTISYKQEDNVNFNTGETYPDEVVRYGKDYNYQAAQKDLGKQPVYTAVLRDSRTGAKAEADLISAPGFRKVAAIYVKGRVRMEKNLYANEEMMEVTSGVVTPGETPPPALATTKGAGNDVFIQRVASHVVQTGADRSYRDQGGYCSGSCTYRPDYLADPPPPASVCNNPAAAGAILTHPTPSAPYCPLTTLNTATGTYASSQCWPDLYHRVYTGTPNPQTGEIGTEIAAGRYNEARDMMHILLGVGERTADLNGAAGYTASKAIFNFDVSDAAVVKYDYRNPDASIPTLEELIGATFVDLRSLADQILVGDQTVKNYNCSDLSGGKDVSGMILGTAADPRLVFFESNMNDDGTYNSNDELSLVTNSGPVHGYGILVINGDATIYGSIDWTGLMIVRGKLHFRPWAGGTVNFRSGPELSTRWNGFIMIGGDPSGSCNSSNDAGCGLRLWTYAGGSISLGFSSSEVASIKGIISRTVPHKVLAWRRTYN